jgi:hypothetical protein
MDVFVNGSNNYYNGSKICDGNLFPLSEFIQSLFGFSSTATAKFAVASAVGIQVLIYKE